MLKRNASIVFLFAVAAIAARAADDLQPGLVGEYFKTNTMDFHDPSGKPVLVRIDKNVNFGNVSGDWHASRLVSNFYVRWTGFIRIEKAGKYGFTIGSDDGSRALINGKEVVASPGVHPFTESDGSAELTAGDHLFKAEFFQGGGEAGCVLKWTPPGGKSEPIPDKVFFSVKGAETKIAWDKAAWEKMPQGKMASAGGAAPKANPKIDKMNYGPTMAGHIEAGFPHGGNIVPKGMAIRVGDKMEAAVCFDPELMRYAFAWTGNYMKMPYGRDGIEGHPSIAGSAKFGTKKNSLGWAKGGSFTDPRVKDRGPKPEDKAAAEAWTVAARADRIGPLPADWAKFKGHYMDGNRVVLSYTVGDCAVLETPGFADEIFTRTFEIGKSSAPLTMLVCELDGSPAPAPESNNALAVLDAKDSFIAASAVGAPAGTAFSVEKGARMLLTIPAVKETTQFTVKIWNGAKADLSKFMVEAKKTVPPVNFAGITKKGGAPRWNPPIETVGALGTEPGAYAADTITVPYDNPWDAYMRLTGLDFFSDGRAAVGTMSGDIWVISGIDEKLEKITWKRFATGIFQPLGLKIVDDKIYALGRDQVTRFHDLNNDGEADFYENFNNDGLHGTNYHEFAHDLQTDTEGNFYYVRGSNLGAGGTPHNGCLMKLSKDGSKLEAFCHGFRAPNGMCVGPQNQITTGDNQGDWIPSCPINWCVKDGNYGFVLDTYPASKKGPRAQPLCWMPYSQDNSSGGQVWATGGKWGPLNGFLLHCAYGTSSLFAVLYEQDGDKIQGGTVKFPIKFISGIMRPRFSPKDGQFYVAGMRGWQTNGARDGAFQRVRYTGKPYNSPVALHVHKSGVTFAFSDPVEAASAGDAENYSVQVFNYVYTNKYGSDEYSPADCKAKGISPATDLIVRRDSDPVLKSIKKNKEGRDTLNVKSAKLRADGKTVDLEIENIEPVTNMIIKYKIKAADGSVISQEINNTINYVPER